VGWFRDILGMERSQYSSSHKQRAGPFFLNWVHFSAQAQFLNQVPTINKSISSNGVGSLIFGNLSFGGMMYANSGMGFWGTRMNMGVLGFYDIHDTEGVYQLINKIRNDK
jgi:hypothetical protein